MLFRSINLATQRCSPISYFYSKPENSAGTCRCNVQQKDPDHTTSPGTRTPIQRSNGQEFGNRVHMCTAIVRNGSSPQQIRNLGCPNTDPSVRLDVRRYQTTNWDSWGARIYGQGGTVRDRLRSTLDLGPAWVMLLYTPQLTTRVLLQQSNCLTHRRTTSLY